MCPLHGGVHYLECPLMEVPLYTHAQCMGTANLVQYTLHSMDIPVTPLTTHVLLHISLV